MTNAPLMLNVDCDMYANNPQVFLHAMCMVFGLNDEEYAFFQFPQAFYDGLKDDPFGNQLANLYYIANGIQSLQGYFYGGSNCFHRRKVIYGSSPSDTTKFGNAGWLYGSTVEDILTGLNIHEKGWRSTITSPEPLAFLGCAPSTYTSSLIQQKRWSTGLLEILFTNKNPFFLTITGRLWFREALAYFWLCSWGVQSIPELCYATLPTYCILTNSHFLPKINEPTFLIPMGIFIIYNLYTLWELKRLGISLRMWWNLQRMGRVNAMTAWIFGFLSVMLKLLGLSQPVFEVTQKEQSSNDADHVNANAGRFTYDKSPIIIPGVVLLLVNMTALINGMSGLVKVDSSIDVLGLGEMFCSLWVILCFWEFLKGLFGNGKYGIPASIIWKSGALALFFVQIFRRSSQLF